MREPAPERTPKPVPVSVESEGNDGFRYERTPPGWEGSIGPGPKQYGQPHVYARDIHSGAGNCVCGRALVAWIHIQAAPGIPIPDEMRPSRG